MNTDKIKLNSFQKNAFYVENGDINDLFSRILSGIKKWYGDEFYPNDLYSVCKPFRLNNVIKGVVKHNEIVHVSYSNEENGMIKHFRITPFGVDTKTRYEAG